MHEDGILHLFHIEFSFADDNGSAVFVLDRFGIHPIGSDGIIQPSTVDPDLEYDFEIYNDVIAILQRDGALF
jgi:hypothetical protein